jgi:internalin A
MRSGGVNRTSIVAEVGLRPPLIAPHCRAKYNRSYHSEVPIRHDQLRLGDPAFRFHLRPSRPTMRFCPCSPFPARFVFAIALAALVISSSAATSVRADGLFADKNLEAVVRQYVFEKRNTDKPLVEADVQNISTITGKGKQIKSLAGLEKCVALAAVDLSNNEIEDLSPLKDLKNIQQLILPKNKIADLKPLEGLTGLQYLDLADNQIADLVPLAKLEKCYYLELSRNKVTDIAPLANLKSSVAIYLRNNQVTDLKPLAELKKLERLDLRGCGVSDLSPLSKLTEWKFLMLDNNKITDLAVLVEMAKADNQGQKRFSPFWNIYLFGNPLTDAAKAQIEELKKYGGRPSLEETK